MGASTTSAPTAAGVPPLARVVGSGTYYGWYVAVACLVIMCVTVGVSYYGLSLFLQPLRDEHGWSNAVVSGATGAFFVISGVAGFVAGPFIDRAGPRRFLAIGITLTAASAAAVGVVEEVWQLYAVYTVLAVAYGLGAVVPVSTLMSRWFIHQRAKAMMISSTGVSLGGAVLVPIGAVLIDHGGLALAAPILGLVVFVVAMPVLLLVVAPAPADLGLEPDGGFRPTHAGRLDEAAQYRVWTRAEAVRTAPFWAATIAFFLALGATTGVLIYQLSFLQEPDKLGSRPQAALAVTVTTIGSIVARALVGLVADRLDKRRMAAVLFVAQASAIGLYLVVHDTVPIYLAALLFGFTVGNVYLVQSLLIGELFGLVSFATVYGMIALTGQIGSGLSLVAVGALVDAHGYTAPFLLLAGLDVVAAMVVLLARPPAPETPGRPEPAAVVGSRGVSAPDELTIDRQAPVRRVDLGPGSWVDLVDGFVRQPEAAFRILRDGTPWQTTEVLRYDRYVPEKRLSAGLSGERLPLLRQTELHLRSRYRVPWTGVAAILYRDGEDFQGFHGDRELRWLDDTRIAIVVLGARRPFVLRPRRPGPQMRDGIKAGAGPDDVVLLPGHGDLLVMGGACQRDWLHTVPPAPTSEERISLTWRWTSRRGRPDTNPTYYEGRQFSDRPRRPGSRARPA